MANSWFRNFKDGMPGKARVLPRFLFKYFRFIRKRYRKHKKISDDFHLRLDCQNAKAVLTWDEISGASSYTIFRALGKHGSFKKLATVRETSFRDVFRDSVGDKKYLCAGTFIDPSIQPFLYQVRTNKRLYSKEVFHLEQPAIVSYDEGVLIFSRIPLADSYIIYKGKPWEEVLRVKNKNTPLLCVEVPFDEENPYFTVKALGKDGQISDGDEGFYVRRGDLEKRVLFLGDSITYGSPYKSLTTRHIFSYPYRVHQLLGIRYFNPSIPGSTLGQAKDAGRFQIIRDVFEPILKKEPTGNHEKLGIPVEDYPEEGPALSAYDAIVLGAGTNDYGNNVPLGDVSDMGSDTSCGALNMIFSQITIANQYRIDAGKAPIQVIALDLFYSDRFGKPSIRNNRFVIPNELGLTLSDYQEKFLKIYQRWDVPVVRFPTGEFCHEENVFRVTTDNLHMTRASYGKIGNALASILDDVLKERR